MNACIKCSRLGWMALALAILGTLGGCVSTSSDGNFTVKHRGSVLVGDLTLPSGAGPHPAVIFIHGDGAMTANSYGYSKPLKDAFGHAGFATLSWDKPGVGRSKGDWLTQSMQDRADEAIAVAKALKQRADIDGGAVGLWGISQAGWVMPLAVSQSSEFAFMISVSAAINWQRQGRYLTRNRLLLEGYDEAGIETALAFGEKENALLASDASYETYLDLLSDAPSCCRGPMDEARWRFVSLNIDADAIEALRETQVPVLALFGDKDLNVDSRESASVYERELPRSETSDVTIKMFENADHSLYPSSKGRISGTGFGDTWRVLKVAFLGADAFAPGYISSTVDWAVNWYRGRQPDFQDHKVNEL
ncbi:MAG: pimeloyl-ACP methyl ester carboxylesterase [Granulosicoccus sp.]|jgi:pimeloyl-ACP methyl ester carboxylesterase